MEFWNPEVAVPVMLTYAVQYKVRSLKVAIIWSQVGQRLDQDPNWWLWPHGIWDGALSLACCWFHCRDDREEAFFAVQLEQAGIVRVKIGGDSKARRRAGDVACLYLSKKVLS